MRDTIKTFEKKQKLKLMSADDQKDTINSEIQQQIVNNYFNREAILRSNLNNIYGLVWNQFYHGIKSIFCNKEDSEEKSDISDCLWIIEQVKEVTLGLDIKSIKQYNIHDVMFNFLAMIQGKQ